MNRRGRQNGVRGSYLSYGHKAKLKYSSSVLHSIVKRGGVERRDRKAADAEQLAPRKLKLRKRVRTDAVARSHQPFTRDGQRHAPLKA